MYEMSPRSKQEPADRAERAGERARRAADRAAERVERATEQAAEQVERAAERAEREVERARQQVERSRDRAGEMLVWLREEPAARRPSHTRADIARAAIEIADSEGFEAVSMRRVAQTLGAGTMTLYHYVRNKDELVSLMSDSIMGEVLVPEGELADDWRTALTQIATRTRAIFARHRWIFERFGDGRPGPNGMRHFEQSLAAVASLDLDREEIFDLIGLVDDYVFGYALREVQELEEQERGWPPEVIEFLQREIDTGNYPLISSFFGNDADAGVEEVLDLITAEGRFDRGLKRLLDGIEANLPSRT
jgi:AcrR family transcriptional regulator